MLGWYGFPATASGVLKIGNHGNGFVNQQCTPKGRVCSTPIRSQPPPQEVDTIMQFIHHTFPFLQNAPLIEAKICWYCDSWDGNFYIDHVPGRPGLVVAAGGSGHGFKFAPVIGDIVADVVQGAPNPFKARFAWRTRPHVEQNQSEACRLRTTGPQLLPHQPSKL